jgi:hypothetical protein
MYNAMPFPHSPYGGIHQGCPYNAMPFPHSRAFQLRYFGVSLSITLSGFPLFSLLSLFSLSGFDMIFKQHFGQSIPRLWSIVEHNVFQFSSILDSHVRHGRHYTRTILDSPFQDGMSKVKPLNPYFV